MPLNKNPEKEILQLLTQKTDSVFAAEMREQQKMFFSKSFELSHVLGSSCSCGHL